MIESEYCVTLYSSFPKRYFINPLQFLVDMVGFNNLYWLTDNLSYDFIALWMFSCFWILELYPVFYGENGVHSFVYVAYFVCFRYFPGIKYLMA